ncbi:MAG: hypothetical protein HFI73_04140 [Bacilli bacterium]|jgi:uncharacterized membrane protein YheB (UPF0754 family)|nr:hypothetical protein [Bacilli bacterium]
MSLKDKLAIIKNNLVSVIPVSTNITTTAESSLVSFDDMDSELDLLLKEEKNGSLLKTKINFVKDVIRFIVVLDISNSMTGTEEDIYLGLQDLINKHKDDNILLNFIAFNDDRYILLDDVAISTAKVSLISANGGTDLNGTIDYVIKEKCKSGINLLVTISDGEDTENRVQTNAVRETLISYKNSNNHFYFLGEPNFSQKPEDVYEQARKLGFSDENISVFTRKGNGNKLNFAVISDMLEELIYYGKISDSWSKPIKEHYLALTDRKC